MSYKLLKNTYTGVIDSVKYYESGNSEVKIIPFATENADYQEYLKWKSDGGVPDAAD